MAASSSRQLSEEIDRLLEHYLQLLHQYDTLRTSLSTVQSSTQQSLARANFTAPHGVRYGKDLYDGRMQATLVCSVTPSPSHDSPVFTVKPSDQTRIPASADAEVEEGEKLHKEDAEKRGTKPKDPIRMFGILTPQALRMAQVEAGKMVRELVPRLVSVDAEMREVEIRVRRARKFRARAEEREKEGSEVEGVMRSREGEGVVA